MENKTGFLISFEALKQLAHAKEPLCIFKAVKSVSLYDIRNLKCLGDGKIYFFGGELKQKTLEFIQS